MRKEKLKIIGEIGYTKMIESIKQKELRQFDGEIVGFDTEYTSDTNELISVQLWTRKGGKFIPCNKITTDWLLKQVSELLEYVPESILFASYFSLAELQFMPVYSEGFNFRQAAAGSIDVEFNAQYQDKICNMIIFDLWRWFNYTSLKKAAQSFGLKKLEMDTHEVTRKHLKIKKFREYALHDSKLAYQIMIELRKNISEFSGIDIIEARTPAQASACSFRKLFIPEKTTLTNNVNEARRLAMKASWGGRAEVFARGKLAGCYTEYDLKAAYPSSVLKIKEFPIQNSWKKMRSISDCKYSGFIHVDFSFPLNTMYPCLPVETDSHIIYPLQGESFCTTFEIQEALKLNAKVKLNEGYYYTQGSSALADYMQMLLDLRKNSTGSLSATYKLLANSLTGKFAQAISKIKMDEYERLAKKLDTTLDDVMSLSPQELKALDVFPTVSVGTVFMPEWYGLITGYTRAALQEMLVSSEGVYCHTDSVWSKQKPVCKRLDFDAKGSGPVTIVRSRFAKIGNEHTARHSVASKEIADKLLNEFNGQEMTMEYLHRRPLKFKESTKYHLKAPGKWITEIRIADTFWDDKRMLLFNGFTSPWLSADHMLKTYHANLKIRHKRLTNFKKKIDIKWKNKLVTLNKNVPSYCAKKVSKVTIDKTYPDKKGEYE